MKHYYYFLCIFYCATFRKDVRQIAIMGSEIIRLNKRNRIKANKGRRIVCKDFIKVFFSIARDFFHMITSDNSVPIHLHKICGMERLQILSSHHVCEMSLYC